MLSYCQVLLHVRSTALLLTLAIFIINLAITPATADDITAEADAIVSEQVNPDSQFAPNPVSRIEVRDNPNDAGGAVLVTWSVSPDDHAEAAIPVSGYRIYRATSPDDEYEEVGDVPAGTTELIDGNTSDDETYYYNVMTVSLISLGDAEPVEYFAASIPTGPVSSSAQWFDLRRINVFVGTVILCFLIIFMIFQAKSGKELFIRKLGGMEAVDEAIGRATEMGRKIFYVPGINDMDNVQTIASMTILSHVAEMAAQYETWIEVPVCRSLVMVTAKEVVREAYTKAGRPDAFQENQVHYLTDDQFGYAAAIDGMVVREKPATIFYMGAFFAESLILAETGNATGAIQIAGTAMPSQLPFFVAACDYTLIGEELFAASAYLSREPKLLGSLKGQDYGKAVILVAIGLGIVLETFGVWKLSSFFSVIE